MFYYKHKISFLKKKPNKQTFLMAEYLLKSCTEYSFLHRSKHLITKKFSASTKWPICVHLGFFTSHFALQPHTDLDLFPEEEVRILE